MRRTGSRRGLRLRVQPSPPVRQFQGDSLAVLGGYFGDVLGPLDEKGGGLAVRATVGGYVGS